MFMRACVVILVVMSVPVLADQFNDGEGHKVFPANSRGLKDALGDPLPEHALARLGTLRLHFTGIPATAMAYSPDGKTLCYLKSATGVEFVDAATGKPNSDCLPIESDFDLSEGREFVKYLANGKQLLVRMMGEGKFSKVWDLETRKEICKLEDSDKGVLSMGIDRDGTLICGVLEGEACLWNPKTGKKSVALGKEKSEALSVALSSDGKMFAVGTEDKKIHLCNTADRKLIRTIDRSGAGVSALAFSPDGKILCSGDTEYCAYSWNINTGERMRKWTTRPMSLLGQVIGFIPALEVFGIRRMEFSPDGKILGVAAAGMNLSFWDPEKAKRIKVCVVGHEYLHKGFSFSPDSTTIALSIKSSIGLWHLAREQFVLPGHFSMLQAVRFTKDGSELVTSCEEGYLLHWKPDGTLLKPCSEPVSTGCFGPHAEWIASPKPGKITITSLNPDTKPKVLRSPQVCMKVAASPDGTLLAGMDHLYRTMVWDVATEKTVANLGKVTKGGAFFYRAYHGDHLSFSPDNRLLAGFTPEGTIAIWNIQTGKIVRSLGDATDEIPEPYWFAFSPDSRLIAYAKENDKEINLIEIHTGASVGLATTEFDTWCMRFSPDGRHLVVGDTMGYIHWLSVENLEEVGTFHGHLQSIVDLQFSPDQLRLASASVDTTAVVWDIQSLKLPDRKAIDLSDKELNQLWNDLGTKEAGTAYKAVHRLAACKKASALIRSKFDAPPAIRKPLDEQAVHRIIALLDDPEFDQRTRAEQDLIEAGTEVVPVLKKQLEDKQAGVELRRRLERILSAIEARVVNANLPWLRACVVLESIGDDEAKALLKRMAEKEHLAQSHAKASLQRLK